MKKELEAVVKNGRPEIYSRAFIEKQATLLMEYANNTDLPLLKEFASTQGYTSQRISEWANVKHPQFSQIFSETLKRYKDIQESKWCHALARGKAHPAGAIFILKNISGMRDEQHITSEGAAPIINIVRIDGHNPKALPEQLRFFGGTVPSTHISLGNGKVSLPNPPDSDSVREVPE